MINLKIIRQKIVDWQNDMISKECLQQWGEDFRLDAYLNEDEELKGIEVLSYLEFMNIDKTLKEDIPYVLEFIDSDEKYEDAYKKWYEYLNSIDYKKRAKELKNDPFYAPYCE